MTTELFLTKPRLGTVTLTSGDPNIIGTGTNFTASDINKPIIIRTAAGDFRTVVFSFTDETHIKLFDIPTINQSGCYFYIDAANIDLKEDFPYSLNYSIADVRNPEKRNSSFSKTITIPGTKNNNIVFDHIFEIDLEGSFNPNIRAFATVYSNFIPVFVGNLQLLKINRTGDLIEYEVCVFGKVGDLFQKVADKLVTDLDLSDLNETGDNTDIQNSWSSPADLFYPLLANGRQVFSTAIPAYTSDLIAPAIRVSTIFERILSASGYQCNTQSDLYTATKMDKLYIPTLKDWRRKASLKISTSVTATGEQVDIYVRVIRARTGATEDNFVHHHAGTSTLISYISLDLDGGDLVELFADPTGAITIVAVNTYFKLSYTDTEFTYNNPGNIYVGMTTNQSISSLHIVNLNDDSSGSFYDPYNTFNTTSHAHTVPVKQTQGFLPDNYKQRDFLLALIKMFNLYLEPVVGSDYLINILPRNNYYDNTNVVDWTEKLDVGQEINLIPMGELDWKEYLFSWKPDDDFFNKDYRGKTFETYGQRTVLIENDFLTNKNSIDVQVGPFPLSGSGYHSLVMPVCIKDGVTTVPNQYSGTMRIIYYDSSQLISGTVKLDGVTLSSYPFSGHLVGTPQAPTFDFNWAAPRYLLYKLDDVTLYPKSENLYTEYWEDFINEISDKYSKILIAYFYLTPEDIRTLDFSAKYFVNGSWFRLNKIIDFNPTGTTLTKVELLRINEAVYVSSVVSHGHIDPTYTSPATPPYASSSLPTGAVIIGDDLGLATVSEALTSKGDIFVWDGTALKKLRAPATGEVLSGDTTEPTGLKWITPSGGSFDPTAITGWSAINPDLVLATDGVGGILWKQNA